MYENDMRRKNLRQKQKNNLKEREEMKGRNDAGGKMYHGNEMQTKAKGDEIAEEILVK